MDHSTESDTELVQGGQLYLLSGPTSGLHPRVRDLTRACGRGLHQRTRRITFALKSSYGG